MDIIHMTVSELNNKLTATFDSTDFNFKYDKNFKPNKFFDEILKIDHCIEVPSEYKDVLESHICMCGKLIFSSFLPDDLRREYNDYVHQKSINEVINKATDNLVEDFILKDDK